MRREGSIGYILLFIYIITKRFFNVPDIFLGIIIGLSLCFMLIAILSKDSYDKLKKWKKSIFNQK